MMHWDVKNYFTKFITAVDEGSSRKLDLEFYKFHQRVHPAREDTWAGTVIDLLSCCDTYALFHKNFPGNERLDTLACVMLQTIFMILCDKPGKRSADLFDELYRTELQTNFVLTGTKKAGTEAARKRNLWRKQLEVKCREMSAIKSEMVTIIYATKNAKNATASNVRCPTMPLQQQELKTRRKRKVALTEEPDPLSVLLSPFCMTPSAK